MLELRITLTSIFTALLLAAAPAFAQDKNAALHQSLRDVINAGADLFNLQGDHAGCCRLYEGSLRAIKPLLTKSQQDDVDTSLADAAKMTNFADRATRLRETIDAIREQIAPKGAQVPQPPVVRPLPRFETIAVPPTKLE